MVRRETLTASSDRRSEECRVAAVGTLPIELLQKPRRLSVHIFTVDLIVCRAVTPRADKFRSAERNLRTQIPTTGTSGVQKQCSN